ncbi:hypothetical protein K8352_19335, partial [Flavobacteriaceae bacterium F89]
MKTRFLLLFFLISGMAFSQTTVTLEDQCNCEVLSGTLVSAPGSTTPTGADIGDIYVNTNIGTIYFWDGNSWELTFTDTNTTNASLTEDGSDLILTDSDNNSIRIPLATIAAATDTNTTNATFAVSGTELVITDSEGNTVSVPLVDIAAATDSNTTNVSLTQDGTDLILTDSDGNSVTLALSSFAAIADQVTITGAGTTADPFKVEDLSIVTGKLADGAVTTVKLADGAVTTAKL